MGLNSPSYDFLSPCLPIGLWASPKQGLHLLISTQSRQHSLLAHSSCSINTSWLNGRRNTAASCTSPSWLLRSQTALSHRLSGSLLLLLTHLSPLLPLTYPPRGLTPWSEGEQPDGQNHRGAHCESAWGWGEDGLNYIFPGFEGGLCMTHSSCFHLKLISKYHYKWTQNLKQSSMETNHSKWIEGKKFLQLKTSQEDFF